MEDDPIDADTVIDVYSHIRIEPHDPPFTLIEWKVLFRDINNPADLWFWETLVHRIPGGRAELDRLMLKLAPKTAH